MFASSKILFLGHEISKNGIKQDPEKLRAIENLPVPTDAQGVKRVMGLLNYYRRFVPRFAIISEPLTNLTRKNIPFVWGEEQQQAFKTLIQSLLNNATLAHYNHVDPLMLKTDASHQGVAGMLLQKQNDEWKIVTCCIRRLSAAEANYGITDLEGLAIIYSTQKLKPYLLWKKFKILVDHCALCVLNKRIPQSNRLKRWAIILQEFDYEIVYTRGDLHKDIDCLSRAPVHNSNDNYLDDRIFAIIPKVTRTWIQAYQDDDESKTIYEQARKGINGYILVDNVIYYKKRNDSTTIYVPRSRRQGLLKEAHDHLTGGHGGIQVTKDKLADVYWPTINEDIKTFVEGCHSCQTRKIDKTRNKGEIRHFITTRPFQLVALDTLGPMSTTLKGKSYILVAIDVFSRFLETKAITNVKADECVDFLIEYCARYGTPSEILTDNSTQFENKFVKEALGMFGIDRRTATPDHSQSNAPVDRVIQTLQEKIAIALADEHSKDSWDLILPIITQAINSSVHSTTRYSPYEIVFGRRLPFISSNIIQEVSPQDQYLELIKLQLKEIYENAGIYQFDSQQSRKYYRTKPFELQIGDKCMC